jgi:DegV family protein with EDD domain
MYLFFEGFLICLTCGDLALPTPKAVFDGFLDVIPPGQSLRSERYCIDAAIRLNHGVDDAAGIVAGLGSSVVAQCDDRLLKVHLHADRVDDTRRQLAALGALIRWQPEEIHRSPIPNQPLISSPGVHVVTDAAGSLSPDTARRMGISLLDSYLLLDDRVFPESLVQPSVLYDAMARGEKVSTAQASTFERHQHYERLVERHEQVVYLAVGSAFTGNCQVAGKWVHDHRCNARMAVIDTAAASGKLGLLAIEVSRFAAEGHGLEAVAAFAAARAMQCDELVFLDQLKFLAAGGRISKARGMVGDFLRFKPVIRPTARGAEKAGAVKSRSAQLRFALETMGASLAEAGTVRILLSYTDNRNWVESVAKPAIEARLGATVGWIEPMSLTSGAHMGPGTWAVAYLPVRRSPRDRIP